MKKKTLLIATMFFLGIVTCLAQQHESILDKSISDPKTKGDSISFKLQKILVIRHGDTLTADSIYFDLAKKAIDKLNRGVVNSVTLKDSILNFNFDKTIYKDSSQKMLDASIYNIFSAPGVKNITLFIRTGFGNFLQSVKTWPFHKVYGYEDSILMGNRYTKVMITYKWYAKSLVKSHHINSYSNSITHEYCHMIGFVHVDERNWNDVPNKIGDFVGSILNNWDKKQIN